MKKYIADTNFILRYLLADNKEDYKKTKIIFEQARIGKCQIEIIQSVFAEVIFVLSSFYEVPKIEIVRILKSLLSYKGVMLKSEANIMGMKNSTIATKISFDVTVPDSALQLPDFPLKKGSNQNGKPA